MAQMKVRAKFYVNRTMGTSISRDVIFDVMSKLTTSRKIDDVIKIDLILYANSYGPNEAVCQILAQSDHGNLVFQTHVIFDTTVFVTSRRRQKGRNLSEIYFTNFYCQNEQSFQFLHKSE